MFNARGRGGGWDGGGVCGCVLLPVRPAGEPPGAGGVQAAGGAVPEGAARQAPAAADEAGPAAAAEQPLPLRLRRHRGPNPPHLRRGLIARRRVAPAGQRGASAREGNVGSLLQHRLLAKSFPKKQFFTLKSNPINANAPDSSIHSEVKRVWLTLTYKIS